MNASRKLFVLFLAWTAALVLAPQAQVVVTGSIGDTVFIDYNANDLPDAGEGAPGVTMTLYDETGVTVLDTTATDASGQYLFAGLATGTYVVAVATNTLPAPAGQWINTYDPDGGTPDRSTVTLPHSPSNGPLAVLLGTAETYAVLAGSTVTSTGDTTVDGDLGVSPGSAVTGFPPGILSNGVFHVADAPAIQAQVDLVAAYNDVAGRGVDATLAAELGGTTLTPGVYDSADTTFGITGTLTLDAQGDANAVFIFQAGSTLITAGNSQVVLINGAQAGNVFWQVGSSATLGTDSTFAGSILALTSITLTTGANVEGRVLARNGAVTMDSNHVGLPRLAGENDLDQDFGYQADNPNTIGGTLWDDLNANGLLEAGEIVRFAGVTVDLQVANGTVILTTATDAGGNYSFANLPDATYVVDVTDTGSVLAGYGHTLGPSPNSDNNSQSDPYTVAVGGGESNTTGDFGYSTGVATLGDFVWRDANEDGVQDAGEPGVSGVVVTLYDAASVAVDSTTTSVAGAYEFASLVPGVYHLGFAIPPGDVASPPDQGGNDARDSDVNPATGQTIPTTLVAGENDRTWDLGIYQAAAALASLGDFVWRDLDADGVQDAGESGVSGVVVTLYDAASVAVDSTTTSVAGAYEFASLVPGVYNLGFAIPPGDVASPPDQGGDDARDSDVNPATGRTILTTLVAGENDVTWDLGIHQDASLLASLGDFVWRDMDADGVQDAGELGVSGVVVTLYNAASVAVGSTQTSVAGAYGFANLVPGVYHLGFAIPPGAVASPQDRGGNDARDSDVNPATGQTIPTTLVAGENDLTWDLGIYQRASLGDFVWWDTDADGVQDAGELGVSGLVVTLYNAASVAVGSTTTSVAGAYGFANLVPGVYHLGFSIPVGDVASPQDQGGNDARDSDANPATGRTIPTTLVAGENDVTWDLGVISGSPLLAVIGNVEAFTRDGQSVVRWETIESWGTAGFWLERLVGDEWVRISADLLPFPLFGTAPIVYEETDPGVQAGGTYSWRLVELENSGNELTYGPYLLTVDGPGRTYADWAAAHFTPEELADPALSGPDADPDGDHLTNGEEFLAWTDPNQPDSVLQISSVNRTSDGLELNWDSVAGRFYRIALSDHVAGPYLPLAEPILATDGNGSAKLSVDFQDRQMYFHVILVGGE